jgi:hypothetical protein
VNGLDQFRMPSSPFCPPFAVARLTRGEVKQQSSIAGTERARVPQTSGGNGLAPTYAMQLQAIESASHSKLLVPARAAEQVA